MKKYSKDQIVQRLQKEGLHFAEFTLSHEGIYEVDDADWNYKDVPHLHFVHELAEAIPTVVGDDLITSVNMQKVLWFRFPFSLTNFESGLNSQTYYTTWLFFVLLIHTRYESTGNNRTRVDTTYSVGSPWWLKWTFPIIRWILKRNYDNLMSTDIPMRLRRGELRGWGYRFLKEGEKHSFEKTMDITKTNVLPPAGLTSPTGYRLSISEVLPADGDHFLGRDDHLGLRIARRANKIMLFPRMCSHEGASLDRYKCSGPKEPVKDDRLVCPWHGRVFRPLASIDLNSTSPVAVQTSQHTITCNGDMLSIDFLART